MLSLAETVVIDDGHFFVDLAPFCHSARSKGRRVIVTGLQCGDYLNKIVPNPQDPFDVTGWVGGNDKYKTLCPTCDENYKPPTVEADVFSILIGDEEPVINEIQGVTKYRDQETVCKKRKYRV